MKPSTPITRRRRGSCGRTRNSIITRMLSMSIVLEIAMP
jgi:hypothetical protein